MQSTDQESAPSNPCSRKEVNSFSALCRFESGRATVQVYCTCAHVHVHGAYGACERVINDSTVAVFIVKREGLRWLWVVGLVGTSWLQLRVRRASRLAARRPIAHARERLDQPAGIFWNILQRTSIIIYTRRFQNITIISHALSFTFKPSTNTVVSQSVDKILNTQDAVGLL